MLRYNPALDGIRALAVLAVLAFHMSALGGGYLGVDVFLVLSGFLITSLMLTEHQLTGAISITKFYIRRAYRLLPGFLFFVAVGAVLVLALKGPAKQREFFENALSALLYVNNYFRIVQRANDGGSWLGHVWSLSLEEQFYLLWPLCLVVLCGRPRLQPYLPRLLIGAAASVVAWRLCLIAGGADDLRIYWGLDSRADSLLVGCALAAFRHAGYRLTPGRPGGLPLIMPPGVPELSIPPASPATPAQAPALIRQLAAAGPCAFAGLLWLVIVAPALNAGVTWLDRVGYTLVALLAALLILSVDQLGQSWWKRLLGSKPLAGLGRMSYGFYLWHFPVAALSGARLSGAIGRPGAVAVAICASVGLAALSERFVERPIQRRCPAWARSFSAAAEKDPSDRAVVTLAAASRRVSWRSDST